jgi:Holliday junction resolvase
MSLRRYANRRDASEKPIVDLLEKTGCSVVRLDKPVDLLVGYRGVTHLVEVKTGGTHYGKKLNANQSDFADGWRGSPVVVMRTADDALRILTEWGALGRRGKI